MSILAAYAVPHPPLIIPTVGRGEERGIQDTIDAYREIARRIAEHNPQTIIITSPHAPLYRDAFHLSTGKELQGSMERFRAPETTLSIALDQELGAHIEELATQAGLQIAGSTWRDHEMDHATFIPLYFIEEAYRQEGRDCPCKLLRIGLSGLSAQTHRRLGQLIAQAVADVGTDAIFVASGDLSHKLKANGPYGFAPEGPQLDAQITELFASGRLEGLLSLDEDFCDRAAECGVRSFQIMAGALESTPYTSELLCYEGPFGVGYAVAAFETQLTAAAADPYVALARASVEGYVRSGQPIERPTQLPKAMTEQRAGVFVSLHKHDELRGCIGTISPVTSCIADEIIANGISAATRDPRFDPVREEELDFLSISVDVLAPPESISSPSELDPTRYGVIVTKGFRRGLLLPMLEGIETVEDQLAIAKRKAGIRPDDDDVKLERFEVVRHERGGEARRV